MRRPALLLATLLAATPAAAHPDPLEGVNRRVHRFNAEAQARVLTPLAEWYRARTTPAQREGVANVMATLQEPVTAASSLAAGRWDLAWNATARFGINATLGYGVRDRAAELGYARQAFAPGDALCAWGVPSGPYLVLPLLGPATLRDAAAQAAAGTALSHAISPDALLAWGAAEALLAYEQAQPALTQLEAQSLDPYAALRSAWLQRRAAACAADRATLMAELDDAPAR